MSSKVYVTGIGMVTPLGLDVKSTWKALLQGKSGIASIASFDTQDFETTIAGEALDFDPTVYVDRKRARRLDRFAQFAVAATAQALEQASLNLHDGSVDATRVGSVIGSGIGGIITLSEQWAVLNEKGPTRVNPFLVPMMLADMAPGQVSIIHGAKGPNYCTVTACSSGADGIGIALEMIQRGDVDIALAGALRLPSALSPSQDSTPAWRSPSATATLRQRAGPSTLSATDSSWAKAQACSLSRAKRASFAAA